MVIGVLEVDLEVVVDSVEVVSWVVVGENALVLDSVVLEVELKGDVIVVD